MSRDTGTPGRGAQTGTTHLVEPIQQQLRLLLAKEMLILPQDKGRSTPWHFQYLRMSSGQKKSPLSLSREHRENQRELGTARGQSSPATTPSSQSQFLRCSTWWRGELRSRSRSWDLCRTLVALRDPTSEGVVTHVSHRVIWVYVDQEPCIFFSYGFSIQINEISMGFLWIPHSFPGYGQKPWRDPEINGIVAGRGCWRDWNWWFCGPSLLLCHSKFHNIPHHYH